MQALRGLVGSGLHLQSASHKGKDILPYTPDSKALRSKEHGVPWYCGKKAQALYMAAAVLGLVFLFTRFLQGGINVTGFLIGTLDWARALGVWSVPVLIGCEMLAFLIILPISPLHIGIGFLYGPLMGTLLAWGAYCAGCVTPFLLARMPMLADRFKQMRRRADLLDGVFSAVESEPFKLIVCLRLSPMLPSTLNSYLLGLTNVPFWTYFFASCVGALPNVCAYVYLGTLLDSLADIAAGRVKRSPLSWALMGTGVVATVAALAYVSRVATRRVQNARSKHASHSSPSSSGCGSGSGSSGGGDGGGGNRGWRSSTPDAEHTALLSDCSASEHAV